MRAAVEVLPASDENPLNPESEAASPVHTRGARDLTRLVEAAAGGDQESWNALVDRFAATVWAVARAHRLSASDAADVSQTTWLRLLENLSRIQHPERLGAWLATTARRESLRVLELASRQRPTGDDLERLSGLVDAQPLDSDLSAREREALVTELFQRLPGRQQELLRLLVNTEASYREVSAALNMPIGSIGPTRARALERLRRLAVESGVNPEEILFC